MNKYSGYSFPYMFDSSTKGTKIVSGVDKIKADINLLLRTSADELLFRPDVGINLDSLLFMDDVDVTRDMLYTFVSANVLSDLPEVTIGSLVVKKEESEITVFIAFNYSVGDIQFAMGYSVEV